MQTQDITTFKEYIDIIWRRKVWLLVTMSVVFTISVAVAYLLPPVYRSSSTILIEQQEIPQELVRSTVTSYADQRIQVISQRVMTRANLLEIINKFNLYEEEQESAPVEELITRLRNNINMEMVSADVIDPRSGRPTQATIAFSVSFNDQSPAVAQRVTNELTSLYLNENLRSRTRQAVEASTFITEEAELISKQMAELERELAEFKERNSGKLPELFQMNQQLMERSERELLTIEQQLRALKEREIYLESELAQLSPNAVLYTENGERILGSVDQLKVLQAKYLRMSAVYGPELPDLIKMSKEIEVLKKEVGMVDLTKELQEQLRLYREELASARRKYASRHPDVIRLEQLVKKTQKSLSLARNTSDMPVNDPVPDNPAYIQLQAQLNVVKAEKSALENITSQIKSKLVVYEDRLTQTPQVEREYRALIRDYENAQIKYREIKAKQAQVQLSESMESERKGERFTLIEPAEYPETPIKPNRLAILFLGLVFSIGSGLGVTLLIEKMDDTVQGMNSVYVLTGIEPIAKISYVDLGQDKEDKNMGKKFVASAVAGSLIALVVIIFLMAGSNEAALIAAS